MVKENNIITLRQTKINVSCTIKFNVSNTMWDKFKAVILDEVRQNIRVRVGI